MRAANTETALLVQAQTGEDGAVYLATPEGEHPGIFWTNNPDAARVFNDYRKAQRVANSLTGGVWRGRCRVVKKPC